MNNRVAFITGASRGIGRACALALSEAGARVVLAARNRDKLEEVATEIRGAGREAFVVEIDLTSADSINRPSPLRTPSLDPLRSSSTTQVSPRTALLSA
jgi:NAD(P)-dependent dehydrogenase (short-subunit alcohol dehydrogenase family)